MEEHNSEERKITLEYIMKGINLTFNVSDTLHPKTPIFDDMAEFLAFEHSLFEDLDEYSTLDKLDTLVKKAKYYYLQYYQTKI